MQVWYGAAQVPEAVSAPGGPGSVVTIGIFDGVHRGHQAIMERVVQCADRLGAQGSRPLTVAMTFDPHPRHVHQPERRMPLVTSLTDRLASLEATGLDAVLVVPYDLDFAAQKPEEFIATWLRDLLGARVVVVGQDVRFGRDNAGDATSLERIGASMGVSVKILEEVASSQGKRWSSTWIRQCLKDGQVRQAAEILGRPHRLRGTVVHGLRRGRELGFPTANLVADDVGVVPCDGVYAGWVVRDQDGRHERLPAAISIGTNPTFDDVPQRTVEAHVLGRADLNLYGEEIGVELVEHLRPMQAFTGLEPLLVQMRTDIEDTARILQVAVPGPIRPEDVTAH